MQRPVQITFHEVDPSDAMEQLVREKVAHLEEHGSMIIGCRVSVNNVARSKTSLRSFEIVAHVELPGDDLIERVEGEDPYGAIREAFRVLSRRLTSEKEKRHGDVKTHASSMARGVG